MFKGSLSESWTLSPGLGLLTPGGIMSYLETDMGSLDLVNRNLKLLKIVS